MGLIRFSSMSAVAAVAAVVVTGVTGGPASAGGQDDVTQVPCSTTALTTAVSAASPGETLSLSHDCTYHLTSAFGSGEGLPTIDQSLKIRGNGATIVRDGIGTALFRIFHVNSGGNLRLEDLTVRGGNTSGDGGGILVDSGGRLTLVGVDVIDNTSSNSGGGVAVSPGATAVVRRGWLAFNNAANGGGLYSGGTLSVDDSEFSRNHARAVGGALYQDAGNAFVHASVIRRNTSASRGGGVTDSGTASLEFSESKIANNTTAGIQGGGIQNLSSLRLEDTEVSGNVVGGMAGQGGGIYNATTAAVLVLKGSEVLRNSANGNGGSQAGGIYNDAGKVTLDHSHVRDNASTTAPGGVFTTNQFTVIDSTITRNIPTNCAGSPVVVTGCRN
ncbi:hypothetical protein ABTY98_28325 [Streptomyces sp. NPDC096040]|uniref:hypothetical protein n=1 Tax=Streptomyces sp. NPDC096040 TaxID=3155541 RepID=UPI0033283F20